MTAARIISEREYLLIDFYESYREAFGVKPRGIDTSKFTDEELEACIREYNVISDDNMKREIAECTAALAEWKARIVNNANANGISIAKYLSWEFEAADIPFTADDTYHIDSYIYDEFHTFNSVTSEAKDILVKYAKEFAEEIGEIEPAEA